MNDERLTMQEKMLTHFIKLKKFPGNFYLNRSSFIINR